MYYDIVTHYDIIIIVLVSIISGAMNNEHECIGFIMF